MSGIETRSQYQAQRDHLGELTALAAAQERFDARISYPAMTSLHKPLYRFAMEVRENASGQERTINRDEQVGRIARFFGLDGNIVLTHSAGAALVSTLQYFTEAGETVVLPEPAYLFENFVRCLADGPRNVVRISTRGGLGLATLARELNERAVIIETPHLPAFTSHREDVYRIIAEAKGVDVAIYDGVNSFYDEDTFVQRGVEMEGNRLNQNPFPVADKAIRIYGTSKLFPGAFPNLAIVEISDPVYGAKDGAKFREAIARQDFRTPSNIDLFVMAEILNSGLFPGFLKAIRGLTQENFEYVQSSLKGIASVKYDGPHAFIEVSADDFGMQHQFIAEYLERYGIRALNSYQYFTERQSGSTDIRLPIVMDKSDLEPIIDELKERLKIVHGAEKERYVLEAARWDPAEVAA